jgi:hypothetical protein
MPIYEFYSPDTRKLYQFLARSLAYRDKTPRCPDGEGLRMERRVSRFAIIGKAKEDNGDDPFAGMDEAKVEALMADMERDMAGMDDNNPDPRQLGRLMRRMTDMMGAKTPEALKDLVRRLESGEDPEKLEDELGPMGDGDDMGAESAGADALFDMVKKRIKSLHDQPVRDPKLYDFADYVG